MTIVLNPARPHGYRLSAYDRKENDFYPTPSSRSVSRWGCYGSRLIFRALRSIRVAATARCAAAWRPLGST